MKFILIFFLVIVLLFLLPVAYFAFRLWLTLKGLTKGNPHNNSQTSSHSQGNRRTSSYSSSQSTTTSSSSPQGKKIFSPDEGEYVEFEEVP